jgi:hypothetical protein
VIRAVGLGALDNVDPTAWDSRIAALWDERADREADDVARSFSDVGLGHPSTWRHSEDRFAATLFECRALAGARARDISSPSRPTDMLLHHRLTPSAGGTAAREEAAAPLTPSFFNDELTTRNGRLRGRPDHVGIVDGKLVVEDYKSGAILTADDDPAAERRIRDDYRRQLLVYAVLCYETFGVWGEGRGV